MKSLTDPVVFEASYSFIAREIGEIYGQRAYVNAAALSRAYGRWLYEYKAMNIKDTPRAKFIIAVQLLIKVLSSYQIVKYDRSDYDHNVTAIFVGDLKRTPDEVASIMFGLQIYRHEIFRMSNAAIICSVDAAAISRFATALRGDRSRSKEFRTRLGLTRRFLQPALQRTN